jgi:hypothetical protein
LLDEVGLGFPYLDTATRAVLDDLLTQEPLAGDTVPGKTSAYKLQNS